MQLTKQNAHLYEGKKLDAYRRIFHNYPLTVKRNRLGELMYVDTTDTYIRIPDENDTFNAVYFDFIVGEEELNAEPKHSAGESNRAKEQGTAVESQSESE